MAGGVVTWTINGTYVLTFEGDGGRRKYWQGGQPIEDIAQHLASGNYTIMDNGLGPKTLSGTAFVSAAHHAALEALRDLRLPVTVTRSTGGTWQAKISVYDFLEIIADPDGRYRGNITLTMLGTA